MTQKNKKWISKALDRTEERTVAWVIGGRDAATFRRLCAKARHLNRSIFYMDDSGVGSVRPKERYLIGKTQTVAIAHDNINTRHHLGRMTRRTKIVSKKEGLTTAASYGVR